MRDKFIEEMIKEVYGPRDGPEETILGNPVKEYITGIIISKQYKKLVENPDSETTVVLGENTKEDDDDSEEELITNTPSELDPKMRPKSFGVSFLVKGEIPSFKLCISWGRYFFAGTDEKDRAIWKRKSYLNLKEISMKKNTESIILHDDNDGKLFLHLRKVEQDDNHKIIIVNFVNDLNLKEKFDENEMTEASIFQPSIRINMGKGTELEPLYTGKNETLYFLYRNRPVLARGYMCSAIWKKIDYGENIDRSVIWSDGQKKCEEFNNPDVRSEFIPIYPNPSPFFDWPEGHGDAPQLSSYNLSEMWTEEEIDNCLSPIIKSYNNWIKNNERILSGLNEKNKKTASKIIKKQKEALKRLIDGIDLLKKDENVRLAFCFANRSIWWQYKWKTGKKDFFWRPFQLAFILINLEPISNKDSEFRNNIDLLWIPTGGGKTEAYLALMAFTMVLRRRFARIGLLDNNTGAGTAIITRYTLRLLTIQQFRRTLRMVMAAEYLRVMKGENGIGWKPLKCKIKDDLIYGSVRFSAGMWVGGAVSPNHLRGEYGAIKSLYGDSSGGEPAQVVTCPVCGNWLSIPKSGLKAGINKLHIVAISDKTPESIQKSIHSEIKNLEFVSDVAVTNKGNNPGNATVTLTLETERKINDREIDGIWKKIEKLTSIKVASFRASRPGYFGNGYEPGRMKSKPMDFEIYCTNPECQLNNDICYGEGVPLNSSGNNKKLPDGMIIRNIKSPFKPNTRIPVPAFTVDEQVYHKCPTIVISTADKIARLAFEPRAASLFGNVDRYNCFYGFYRNDLLPGTTTKAAGNGKEYNIEVQPFTTPDLIVQDELHLMEGPLGSMFGLYESMVEGLIDCTEGRPRYIASTATIKNAKEQVKDLFARELFQFPPYGLEIDDSFFVRSPTWDEGWDENRPGQIYMGVYSPGMGPLTPIVRIWSRLLKTGFDLRSDENIKYFWTIVGYFNAIRELGGGGALYREDIVERLEHISSGIARSLDPDKVVELSSRINSTDIPQLLSELEDGAKREFNENADAILTTSMFGTGIDIPHLSLMVVNGQPKTTSQYIQATGRVGRTHGGLIVTFLRAGRPRDLSHYEMFPTYHHRIYLEVEPVSVSPFSDGALARASGPAMVSYLRNIPHPSVAWFEKDGKIILNSSADSDIDKFIDDLSKRTDYITDRSKEILEYFKSQKDKWSATARSMGTTDPLEFVEYPYRKPEKSVVLGDPQHEHHKPRLKVVFKNAPQSLREIEETTGFEV